MDDKTNKTYKFSLFREFLHFMAHPDPQVKLSAWNLITLVNVLLTGLLILAISGIFLLVFKHSPLAIDITQKDPALTSLVSATPIWLYTFLALIIGPVGEEVFLRLPLKATLKNIILSTFTGACIFLFFSQTTVAKWYFNGTWEFAWQSLIPATIVLCVSGIYALVTWKNKGNPVLFGLFYYLMAIIFSILHDFTYVHTPTDLIAAFGNHIIQFFSGLYFGFLRMRYGLAVPIIGHACWNSMTVFLKLMA